MPHVQHMQVDHKGQYWLTNFSAKKRKNTVTFSDHYPVILVLDMSFKIVKPKRESQFNFKDPVGQMKFFEMTEKNSKLSEIFSTQRAFEDQVASFEKNMNSIFHQVFPKIREKKRKFKEDEVGFLIAKRKKLTLNASSVENDQAVEEVEQMIITRTEHVYAERVFEAIGSITGEDGKFNNLGAWKELNKINPNRKKQQTMPCAFKDKFGNLLTNHDNIKNHCLNSILNRLRKRPMHPELMKLVKRKIQLSKLRLHKAKRNKTIPWTLKEMEKGIRSMKNKKC